MTMTTMTISEDRVHVDIADESTKCVPLADISQCISLVAQAARLVAHRAVPVGHLAAGVVEASVEAAQPVVGNNQHHNNIYTHSR